ncbi:centriole, cilia and spindle-associated protein [Hypomesus transpacificus]|uniref:centriole, cilia and spindle-associated protein n=1 Tax=Hypomesus transpacificus TaxID=137520 RepID=UPI001F07E2CE|nr:centriole, cilia and spindle-associated protein [Hypomesus transpacificus]XP_046886153.1 centriole, cilia and spindle-associated protein [Hypomesus transpacificus]
MITKKIRSEYMKKFKDPKWETYSKCYEEMVKYRLTRRLLEHSHNPFFWNEGDSDSESSGSPIPLNKNKVEPLVVKDRTSSGCDRKAPEHREIQKPFEQNIPASEGAPHPLTENVLPETAPSIDGQAVDTRKVGETEEERTGRAPDGPKLPEEEPAEQPKAKHSKRPLKLRGPLRRLKEPNKENTHPFALYGGGDNPTDMATKKTHNVRTSSTKEIHESALRAKTRREVERQMQTQQVDRRRAQSADLEKTVKTQMASDYNPWVTEYMRCFSTRSR